MFEDEPGVGGREARRRKLAHLGRADRAALPRDDREATERFEPLVRERTGRGNQRALFGAAGFLTRPGRVLP